MMRSSKAEVAEIRDAVHLCVDMQNIFAPGGLDPLDGAGFACNRLNCFALSDQDRFYVLHHARRSSGCCGEWRTYFWRWNRATRNCLPPSALELVPALARYVPSVRIVDKPAYSAFSNPALASLLIEQGVGTVIVTGAETDVCVLSTVLMGSACRRSPGKAHSA